VFSISLAFFNLIPIPPLDGGQLVLIGLETPRGPTIANEEQLIHAGSWITAVLTIVMFVLFPPGHKWCPLEFLVPTSSGSAESAYFLFDNWR
jgi:Zn-dependent protease